VGAMMLTMRSNAARRARRERRGFTLLETMLSITILLLVFGMAVPLFRSQVRAMGSTAGRSDAQQNVRFAISTIERQNRAAQGDGVIKVKGIDDLLVYRAKCCNPIRGEAIVGYVTRGKGIAVHARACPNVQNLMYEVERKIEVEWERAADEAFPVRLVVRTDDRPGLLANITSTLMDEKANIRSLEARTEFDATSDGAIVEMTVEVRDKKQLEKVVNALRRISGVRDVERQLS